MKKVWLVVLAAVFMTPSASIAKDWKHRHGHGHHRKIVIIKQRHHDGAEIVVGVLGGLITGVILDRVLTTPPKPVYSPSPVYYPPPPPPAPRDPYDEGYREGYRQGLERERYERYKEGRRRGYEEGYEAGGAGQAESRGSPTAAAPVAQADMNFNGNITKPFKRLSSYDGRPRRFDSIVRSVSHRHGVDPNLVWAVMKAESNFNPHARSRAGARGLMQLMPETARQYNVADIYDPAENINGGVHHLRQLLNQFGGNVRLAVAAYNAGAGTVERYKGIPPYSETRRYVRYVLAYYQLYSGRGEKSDGNVTS